MPNGQKCSPPKFIANLLILVLLPFMPVRLGAISDVFPQTKPTEQFKINSNSTSILDSPLKICWSYPTNILIGDKIASDNAAIYISFLDNRLKAINILSGLIAWENNQGGNLRATPVIEENELFIVFQNKVDDNTKFTLRCLNKTSGITLWQKVIGLESSNVSLELYQYYFEGKLTVIASNGNIWVIDRLQGDFINTNSTNLTLRTAPYFAGDRLVFGTADRRIYIGSIKDINVYKEFKVPEVPSVVFQQETNLIWGDVRGVVNSAIISQNSLLKRWRLRTGGSISTLTPLGKNLLITSLDNYVYCVSLKDGHLIWKKRLSGRILTAPRILGNYALLLSVGDSSVLVVNSESGKTVRNINLPGEPLLTGSPEINSSSIILPNTNGLDALTSETACSKQEP